MNLSRAFSRLLAVKEPGYKELDEQLQMALRLVPLGLQSGEQRCHHAGLQIPALRNVGASKERYF